MTIYLILFLGLLSWMSYMGSRVLMSLHAIEPGSSSSAIGLVTVFFANSVLMLGGGYANTRGAAKER